MVHNCSGSVLGALFQRIQLPTFAATVELLACPKAMLFAKELRAMDCIFKGDAEVIIQAIRNKDSTRPEYGHVINDILSLARDFQIYSFSHVKCISNSGVVWIHFFDHFQFSLLITQFFTPIWHHHPISITQYFSHYFWTHTCQSVQLFLFFFLFLFLFSVPKLTKAKIKIKNKKKKPRKKKEKKRVKSGQK